MSVGNKFVNLFFQAANTNLFYMCVASVSEGNYRGVTAFYTMSFKKLGPSLGKCYQM